MFFQVTESIEIGTRQTTVPASLHIEVTNVVVQIAKVGHRCHRRNRVTNALDDSLRPPFVVQSRDVTHCLKSKVGSERYGSSFE